MKRITKYEPSEDSMFPYKLVDNELSTELNAIHQLGRFEDLMQEYNINSIQELENILGSKFIAGFFRSSGKTIVAKGILYNKLSEELGCPLEVVFKAIDKGIKTKKHYDLGSGQEFKEYIEVVEPHLTFTSVGLDWLDENEYFQDYANEWCFHFKDYRYIENEENDEYECLVKLSDYQKTWWLKGKK